MTQEKERLERAIKATAEDLTLLAEKMTESGAFDFCPWCGEEFDCIPGCLSHTIGVGSDPQA